VLFQKSLTTPATILPMFALNQIRITTTTPRIQDGGCDENVSTQPEKAIIYWASGGCDSLFEKRMLSMLKIKTVWPMMHYTKDNKL
jgi:hypothetical protein